MLLLACTVCCNKESRLQQSFLCTTNNKLTNLKSLELYVISNSTEQNFINNSDRLYNTNSHLANKRLLIIFSLTVIRHEWYAYGSWYSPCIRNMKGTCTRPHPPRLHSTPSNRALDLKEIELNNTSEPKLKSK